jgi:hypothetical protein
MFRSARWKSVTVNEEWHLFLGDTWNLGTVLPAAYAAKDIT